MLERGKSKKRKNLHRDMDAFHDLAAIAAEHINIPVSAVKRDYYIVMMLEKLAESEYAGKCVFKGGTSLSKGYPRSILRFSKETDSFYLKKRGVWKDYDPVGRYDFSSWEDCFDGAIRARYETLHVDLLYTDEKQDFDKAVEVFRKISGVFFELGE